MQDTSELTSMRICFRLCQNSVLKPHLSFVPSSKPAQKADVQLLQEFFDSAKRLLVITGAGLSTESGIPDYRYTLNWMLCSNTPILPVNQNSLAVQSNNSY